MFRSYNRRELIELIEGMIEIDNINEQNFNRMRNLVSLKTKTVDNYFEISKVQTRKIHELYSRIDGLLIRGVLSYLVLGSLLLYFILN